MQPGIDRMVIRKDIRKTPEKNQYDRRSSSSSERLLMNPQRHLIIQATPQLL